MSPFIPFHRTGFSGVSVIKSDVYGLKSMVWVTSVDDASTLVF
jgi:hypothetical protein